MSQYLVTVLILAFRFVCSSADSAATVLDPGFEIFVQQLLDVLHVPGLSLAVVRKDSYKSKVRPDVYRVY
jgi:hypothetical protein